MRSTLVFGLYTMLAWLALGRTPAELGQALPLGRNGTATVPLFNLWTIGWNANRAAHGFRDYWDAPIFYPARRTFAFSEAQPLTALLAPIAWWSDTPIVAYQVLLLGSLALNGWCTWRLLTRLQLGQPAALAGGALMLALPFVHGQLEVLQLVPVWGIMGTLTAWIDHARQPTPRNGARVGAWFGVTYLLCNYYGLFLSVLLVPACVLLFWRQLLTWNLWRKSFAGFGIALVLLTPIVLEQHTVSRDYQWSRDRAEIDSLSADPRDYLVPVSSRLPALQLTHDADPNLSDNRRLAVGSIMLSLALVGLANGLANREQRRWTVCVLIMLTMAFALSLGPKLALAGWSLWEGLRALYPGFQAIRSPFRFAVFVHIFVVLLAAQGVQALAGDRLTAWARWMRKKDGPAQTTTADDAPPHRFRRVPAMLPVLCLATLAIYEIWPSPTALFPLPERSQHAGWVGWLREHTPPGMPIAYLPPPADLKVDTFRETTLAMLYGLWHERPMVNGYSGYFPPSFIAQRVAMFTFPSELCLKALGSQGVILYVVRRDAYPWPLPEAPNLHRVYEDRTAGFDIYEYDILSRGVEPGK